MTENQDYIIEQRFLEFVKRRLETVGFRAQEKLTNIDELAEVVFAARKDYLERSKSKK